MVPRRPLRLPAFVLLVVAAALALPAAATAHGDARRSHARHGAAHLLVTHGDRIPRGADIRLRRILRRRALSRFAVTRDLAPTTLATGWCGAERSTDDVADAAAGAGAAIKLVYVRPSDQPDRFADFAPLIQGDMAIVGDAYKTALGGTRTVRFDVGTNCGANYVDIVSLALPSPRSYYVGAGVTFDQRVDRLWADLTPLLGGVSGARDFLIYADTLYGGDGITGVAALRNDETPGAFNRSNSGGLFAFVFGNGSSTFGYSHATTAEHELTHNLGGVQDGAPHSSQAGHCWDQVDVMCYDDGGAGVAAAGGLHTLCAGAAPTLLDCGGDDYLNPSPAPGSYLATHWNIADSAFLCTIGACMTGNAAPVAAFSAPATAVAGQPVAFDAGASSDDGGPIAAFAWDADGDGTADGAGPAFAFTYARAGTYTPRLTVTDSGGATASTTRRIVVADAPPPLPRPATVAVPLVPVAAPAAPVATTAQFEQAVRAAVRTALARAGGVRGLARGRVVTVRFATSRAGRVTVRLGVGGRVVASATAVARAHATVTLRLRIATAHRARVRRASSAALGVAVAFRPF